MKSLGICLASGIVAGLALIEGCKSLESNRDFRDYNDGLEEVVQENRKPSVTFYVSKSSESVLSRSVLSLVWDYFNENFQIPVDYRFVSREEVGSLYFDHRTSFGIVEMTRSEYVEMYIRKMEPQFERIRESYRRLFKIAGDNPELLRFSEIHKKDCEEIIEENIREIRETSKMLCATSDTSEGITYVISDQLRPRGPDSGRRYFAKVFLHEFGHQCGLWHTFEFSDDEYEDCLRNGFPNIMSYETAIYEGKYGFDFEPTQKELISNYLAGGKSFEKMKEFDFELPDLVLSLYDVYTPFER